MCRVCTLKPQAIGTCVEPQKPGDRPARNVVMAVKKAVDRVRKSPAAKVNVTFMIGFFPVHLFVSWYISQGEVHQKERGVETPLQRLL